MGACLKVVPSRVGKAQGETAGSVRVFLQLEAWAHSDEARLLPLGEFESEVASRGKEAMRQLLQEHIDARAQLETVEDALEVTGEDGPLLLSHHLVRTRKLRTTVGGVEIERVGYGYPGASSVFPLDEELQLPPVIYSYPLQKHLVRAAVRGPFGEAMNTVEEFTGERVPKRSLETLLEAAATDFEGFYTQQEILPPDKTSEIVAALVDCKGVPMIPADRKGPAKDGNSKKGVKRMAVVTTVYTVEPRPRTPEEVLESLFRDADRPQVARAKDARPEGKRVSASITRTKDEAIQELADDVQRRDPHQAKARVAITDGERALQKRVRKLMPGAILILDLLHAMGYLWTAGNLLCAGDKAGATVWVKRQLLQVLKGRVSDVVRGIRQSVTKREITGDERTSILDAANYLYRNRRHMAYDVYLAKGFPIASGAVEGACKTLVRDRMERSGMRWSEAVADPLLKLRSVYLSNDFDDFWDYHVNQEQARLHPEGAWEAVQYAG